MERSMRVVVVGSDPLARAGLAATLLQAGAEVTAALGLPDETAAGGRAVGAIVLSAPWSTSELVDTLEALEGRGPILVLAADAEQARVAWARGAAAVLTRDCGPDRLRAALRACTAGLRVVSEAWSLEIGRGAHASSAEAEPLTTRERQVLGLVVEGLSNKVIARRLGLSESTVKHHVNGVLAKLDAGSRTEAALKAVRAGLVPL